MTDYNLASAFIAALTGDPSAIVDFRCIHDSDQGVPAIPMRGTLADCWSGICTYNQLGYGAFVAIQELDGAGRSLANVASIRTHVVDLDDIATAQQSFNAAANWQPAPAFYVNSSPGKYHIYWPSVAYRDNERYTLIERKLVAQFGGDGQVIDAARVMRLPGTLHLKDPQQPHLVTVAAMAGFGYLTPPELLEYALQAVQVKQGGNGGRHDLGDPDLAAPNEDWAKAALMQLDPNELDRAEWITVTSAFKQSIWSHTDPDSAFKFWSEWCALYDQNDDAENLKQWNSIRQTEVGFKNLANRSPNIKAWLQFGDPSKYSPPLQPVQPFVPSHSVPVTPSQPQPFSEMLTAGEQQSFFQGCFFVEKTGKVFVPSGRMMNSTQFNGRYGGKLFIWTGDGKTTDEPWKAATRSTLWTIPKVDHTRFVPNRKPGEIIVDDQGRQGVNVYKPSIVISRRGDPTLFLDHINRLFPVVSDQHSYLDYIAHNVKYPGDKIPWAPLLVSAEGAGKGIIKTIIQHCIGKSRTYSPNAQELIASGSKFNSWMREKLFIIVDEIKVDERRELVEILKPMITDAEIEIQGKGENQDMEDNYSNWQFHSNFKDAIPINKNGRRYAIYYLAPQTADDLLRLGMNEQYFDRLRAWLMFGGGLEIVADYFLNYQIERGAIPGRAPVTSSTPEALEQSQGPLEQMLTDFIADGRPGFRGGWVSTVAFQNAARAAGSPIKHGQTVQKVLRSIGLYKIGRAPRSFFAEDAVTVTTLYHTNQFANALEYGRDQGYE
jgi:hypothetical protein